MSLGPIHCAKFQKIFRAYLQLGGSILILARKRSIYPNQVLIWKKHNSNFDVPFGSFYCGKLKYNLHVLLGPFQCANFKKIFRVDTELIRQTIIMSPKWPIYPNQIFFFSKNH